MDNEILVDLNDVFEMAKDVGSNLENDDQAPVLQVLATIALCERLDRIDGRMHEITDFLTWYQAVSPAR